MSITNILIDCERLKYKYTGLYEYCKILATSICKYNNNKDLHFKFYTPQLEYPFLDPKVDIINQSFIHKLYFPKFKGINIYHSTHQSSSYFPPKSHNWKIVLTLHDFNFLIEKKNNKKKDSLLKKIKKKIDHADAVVFISNYVMNQAIDFWGPSKKYYKIYNGVNSKIQELPVSKVKNINETQKYILALGTVLEKKMFHTIIPIIKSQDSILVIAGITKDKKYVQFIINEAKKHHVLEKIKILGPVSEEEKRWLYKHCQAFVFPSKVEGFGIPIIEAMLFGKPCFTTKNDALPEIGGEHVYYFDDYNPINMQQTFSKGITEFYAENMLKRQSNIIEWATQYSIQSFATNYLKLYESLLK